MTIGTHIKGAARPPYRQGADSQDTGASSDAASTKEAGDGMEFDPSNPTPEGFEPPPKPNSGDAKHSHGGHYHEHPNNPDHLHSHGGDMNEYYED